MLYIFYELHVTIGGIKPVDSFATSEYHETITFIIQNDKNG